LSQYTIGFSTIFHSDPARAWFDDVFYYKPHACLNSKKNYPEHTQWRLCTIFHSVGENSLKAANPPGFLRLSLSPSPSSLIQHDERPASGWLLLWVGGQSIINFPPRAGGRHGISLSRSSVLFCILFASSRVC